MSKPEKKEQAIKLRKQGESIKDIAEALDVSKGSVSAWCQLVKLTSGQKKLLLKKQIDAGHVGRIKGAAVNKEKRLTEIGRCNDEGLKVVDALSERDLLMLGIGLYWGEGVKSRSGQTALVNSDPEVLKIGKKWMEKCLNVKPSDFRPYLYINELHESRKDELLKFWSKTLNIPRAQFNNPIIIKHKNKKTYDDNSQYYGVVALRVAKSSGLKYRILGLIQACIKN